MSCDLWQTLIIDLGFPSGRTPQTSMGSCGRLGTWQEAPNTKDVQERWEHVCTDVPGQFNQWGFY